MDFWVSSLFLGCYGGFCARKSADVKIGKAKMRRNEANLCKSARFLRKNEQKQMLFEPF